MARLVGANNNEIGAFFALPMRRLYVPADSTGQAKDLEASGELDGFPRLQAGQVGQLMLICHEQYLLLDKHCSS